MMSSTEDFLFLPTYHHHLSNVNTDNHNQQRTPSPSSSSSSASEQDNEFGMDPFYSSLLSAPTDFQAELEMDLFPDAEALDTFSELRREEERLKEEMIFSTSSTAGLNIHHFLQEGDSSSINSGTDAVSPFQIEFNSESLSSNSPSSMFMRQNENSTSSSSSSSFDMDLNFRDNGEFLVNTNLKMNDTGGAGATTFADTFALSPSSIDSPPLTPGDIKVDFTNPLPMEVIFTGNGGQITGFSNGVTGTNILKSGSTDDPIAQNTMHSALKSSNKRGRSSSHDEPPDVQALKRHIRMIRNRESASLSRKKKKEYVTGLEDRIKDLEKENTVLKKENQFLRSKLQQNGVKHGSPSNTSSPSLKKKGQVAVLAKVALLGLFGFVMVNFHTSRSPHHLDPSHSKHSNLTEFSRTFTKLRLSEDVEGNVIPPLMAHLPKFNPRNGGGDVEIDNITGLHLPLETQKQHVDGNYSSWSNVSNVDEVNATRHLKSGNTESTPTSYLNGTSYNQTAILRQNSGYENGSNWSSPHVKREQTREREQRPGSRWRSRGSGGGYKKKGILGWSSSSNSLKSANLVFPPFMGSEGVGNSSNPQTSGTRCPNSFNKTESMRVKSDLEDIFGKGKFSQKKPMPKTNPIVKMGEPIVYSLISHNSHTDEPAHVKAVIPQKKALDVHHGLAVYEGDKKKFSTILDTLDQLRREDTFYVVSLASDNQLLLSAKASNESSRPKMTILLPWRNETLKEDMILQIDCEVFQVFNLNEKKQPKRRKGRGQT